MDNGLFLSGWVGACMGQVGEVISKPDLSCSIYIYVKKAVMQTFCKENKLSPYLYADLSAAVL